MKLEELKKASDKDVYKMREWITFMCNLLPKKKTFQKMEKQLDKEWERRGPPIVPLAWDFEAWQGIGNSAIAHPIK